MPRHGGRPCSKSWFVTQPRPGGNDSSTVVGLSLRAPWRAVRILPQLVRFNMVGRRRRRGAPLRALDTVRKSGWITRRVWIRDNFRRPHDGSRRPKRDGDRTILGGLQ
jgi:hypothetical protein